MGLFFTLIYVFTAYIGPPALFGDLVQYHIEVIIALLTLAFTIPNLSGSRLLSMPQTYAVMLFTLAVGLSLVFNGWAGGAPTVMLNFLPDAIVFFFVAANCRKKSHLQMLTTVLFLCICWNIYCGYKASNSGVETSPYFVVMINSLGLRFYRIRALTFLNDPNDFAQLMVGVIPCMFFSWKKGQGIRNLVLVYIPIAMLATGMFLTHSRGSMIALMAAAAVAGRRKFGIVRSLVVGGVIFGILSVIGFSGGRDVSVESGADRMDAWATGLMLIRTHPIFGVGYKRFTDYHELTAHNTVIVCAAELGLVGFMCWMLFTLPAVRDAIVGSRGFTAPKERELAQPSGPSASGPRLPAFAQMEKHPSPRLHPVPAFAGISRMDAAPVLAARRFNMPGRASSDVDHDPRVEEEQDKEIHRLSELLLISMTGFLVCSWFLSRPYTMTLFLMVGMVAAVYRMTQDRAIAPPPLPMGVALKLCLLTGALLIIAVWIFLRLSHFGLG